MSQNVGLSLSVNDNKPQIKGNKATTNKASKKRMATSPAKGDVVKRSAFGDITNAMKISNNAAVLGKEKAGSKPPRKNKLATRKSVRVKKEQDIPVKEISVSPQKDLSITEQIANVTLSLPNSQKSSSSDKYEGMNRLSRSSSIDEDSNDFIDALDTFSVFSPTAYYEHHASPSRRELSHADIDAENIHNPSEAPLYAFVVFEYMRAREKQFRITPYMTKQKEITVDMRAILVDWMVEVQENFELNHETLYLAVKLVDMYLQKKQTSRDALQLIGATSLLIAAKFDERHPPYVDDFLYICDDAYNRKELLSMERSLLYAVGFDINIPISYRFLRRYAKCSKTNMQTLTLARFALELSLQYYQFVHMSDSLLAAASLWLAFKMNDNGTWTDTLRYYSSHHECEVMCLAFQLNSVIIESKGKKLQTVWQKYSHSLFYEVAKTPALTEVKIERERSRVDTTESALPDLVKSCVDQEKDLTNL